MFDEFTEEYFMDQAKSMGQKLGVDTRQGSVYMDAATGHCFRAAKFYNDLRMSFEMMFIDTCTDEILEEKAKERGIIRKQATAAYYNVSFEGVEAAEMVGNRFMVSGYYFTLENCFNDYFLKSEVQGTNANALLPGQPIIPVKNTLNLVSSTLGKLYLPGNKKENDESLRNRIRECIAEASENGNKQQYKTWAESFDGIGRAVVYPLANGPNTVKAVLISSDGLAPESELINRIQNYVDPESEGLGEGVAPIGCKFTAVAATETSISISVLVELEQESTVDSAKMEINDAIIEHFKELALSNSEKITVKYTKIIGIIANLSCIKDFSNLLLNGKSVNIEIEENIPVIGEVSISVGV